VSAPTVGEVGERVLVERIRERFAQAGGPWVRLGIGDDTAVLVPEPRTVTLATTDSLVEGVHFDWRFGRAHDVGRKALAVNLSDIASMGATPRSALLSLGLPPQLPLALLDELLDGVLAEALAHRVALVGGNITRTPGPLFVDVTLLGSAHPRRVLTRAGGSPGDILYVSGALGGAAAGLAWLRGALPGPAGAAVSAGLVPDATRAALEDAALRFRRPSARVALGVAVGRARAAKACMDLSDGLGDAVHQLAGASGTGAVVELDKLPFHPVVSGMDEPARLQFAVSGGEDYELLWAVAPRRRRLFEQVAGRKGFPPISRIGTLTREPDVRLRRTDRDDPLPGGFAHFD
jgi:thiamine-monophosphate kinase